MSPRRARSTRADDPGLYERHAHAWWDPEARFFRSLRSVKAFHLELLRERCGALLRGGRVVDLGCGGGLLSLPLAELGG